MKRIMCGIVIFLLIATQVSAQAAVREEAQESLATAQQLLGEGRYKKAIDEINYALAKIGELTAEALLAYIPEPPPGFSLVEESSQGIGQASPMIGSAGAKASFSGAGGETLTLDIAIGGVVGQIGNLAALGAMFAGAAPEAGVKAIRVQGYTGTQQFNQQAGTGTLIMQVGEKTTVRIEGSGIADGDIMKGLVEKMDLTGLEQNF